MDTQLGVRDTDLEKQKIRREMAMEFPPILLREMASELIKEGGEKNKALAQVFLDEIERMERPATPPPAPAEGIPEEEMIPPGGLV